MKRIAAALAFLLILCFTPVLAASVASTTTPDPQLNIMDGKLYVYKDDLDPANNFSALGIVASDGHQSLVYDLDMNDQTAAYSGQSAIRCQIDATDPLMWGGWLFTRGYLAEGAQYAEPDFGEHPECTFDLTGAESLSFAAKGENGGEKVEFFVGGLGWNNEVGRIIAPYPDSTRKVSLGYVELTDEYEVYTIPLSGRDLSAIGCGFGFVVSGQRSGGEVVFYVDEVYYQFATASSVSETPPSVVSDPPSTPSASSVVPPSSTPPDPSSPPPDPSSQGGGSGIQWMLKEFFVPILVAAITALGGIIAAIVARHNAKEREAQKKNEATKEADKPDDADKKDPE